MVVAMAGMVVAPLAQPRSEPPLKPVRLAAQLRRRRRPWWRAGFACLGRPPCFASGHRPPPEREPPLSPAHDEEQRLPPMPRRWAFCPQAGCSGEPRASIPRSIAELVGRGWSRSEVRDLFEVKARAEAPPRDRHASVPAWADVAEEITTRSPPDSRGDPRDLAGCRISVGWPRRAESCRSGRADPHRRSHAPP